MCKTEWNRLKKSASEASWAVDWGGRHLTNLRMRPESEFMSPGSAALPPSPVYPCFPLPTTHPIQCWKGLYQGLHGFNPVGGVVRGTGRVQSGGAESLQLRLSLEFEFHLQFPWGSPSTELSDFRRSARYGSEREYKKPWKKRAKGNDVITYVLSADQHTPLAHLP